MMFGKKFLLLTFAAALLPAGVQFVFAAGYEITPPIAGKVPSAGLAEYVDYLYTFSLGIVGLVALGALIFAGIQYTVSAGNPALQGDAKDRIYKALIGLAILLGSYFILYNINPDLVNLRNPELTKIPSPAASLSGCAIDADCQAGYICYGGLGGTKKTGYCGSLRPGAECVTGKECDEKYKSTGYQCVNGTCALVSEKTAAYGGTSDKCYFSVGGGTIPDEATCKKQGCVWRNEECFKK